MNDLSVLVIGDPHFKISNVRDTDGMVESIVKICIERAPDLIVVLGDILDRHENVHISPLTRAVNFLELLMRIAPTYVLIGNHDLKNNRQFLSDEHPFNALKYWGDNMTVVDTTISSDFKGYKLTFVPYVPPGRFIEALDQCDGWESSTCIFAHQEFKGAKMGAILSTEGDYWPLTNPYVVSGHIHDYQELQTNILYVGTPLQHAFGDKHDKTISFFKFFQSQKLYHERIDLGLPKKHIVRILCSEVSTYIPRPNCQLKIIIKGSSAEIKAIMKHVNIDLWKKAGYKIAYKDLPSDSPESSSTNNVSRAPQKFSSVLYSAISNEPRLPQLFNKLFGTIANN